VGGENRISDSPAFSADKNNRRSVYFKFEDLAGGAVTNRSNVRRKIF